MESVVFVQDIKNNTWVTCEDETYKTEDLEKIACGIVLYHFDDCFFYNSKERHWRRIDGVQSVEDFQGLVCYHDLSDRFERQRSLNMDRAIFPFRWRICRKEENSYVMFALDMLCGPIRVPYYGNAPLNSSLQFLTMSFSMDVATRRMLKAREDLLYYKSNSYADYCRCDVVHIPPVVMQSMVKFLQEGAGRAFGIKPSVLMAVEGVGFPDRFISRPFDVNITYLRNFLGKDVFEKHFPWQQKDNFQPLCQLLGIDKPPKSLRKAYSFNPYVPVIFLILKQWGLQDINHIQKFFGYDRTIFNVYLANFRAVFRPDGVVIDCCESGCDWQRLGGYARFILERKGEKHFVKVFSRLSLNPWNEYVRDILRMLYDYQGLFSEEILKLLLAQGETRIVHDLMAEAVNRQKYQNVKLEYDDNKLRHGRTMLNCECSIDGYEFHLVKDTDDLYEIGGALCNCVASYRWDVVHYISAIFYVKKDDKYLACIEVKDQNAIVQASGYCNRELRGTLLEYFAYWAYVKGLRIGSKCLEECIRSAGIEPEKLYYEVRKLMTAEAYQKMNFEELTGLADEDIRNGWYIRFLQLLNEKRRFRLAAPPWMEFLDERSYLNYVLPEGGRLIEDAEKGVREAMFVLGVMYLQGRLLMPDLEKSRHWLLRAERKGSKMAAGFLERLDIPEKRLHLMDDLKLMEGLMKMRQRARKAGLLLNYGRQ